MKNKFSKYLSGREWLIEENGWSLEQLRFRETLFTLGNGYLGSRGIYEEIPDGTEPGTYIAGVYDHASAMVPELVNAPNPIDFRIAVEGEKLDIGRMNVLETERVLDIRKGLLARRTVFVDTKNRRFLYESLRFFDLHSNHIGCLQIHLKALDKSAKIIVQDTVDDSVTNIGGVLEGRKRHTQLVDVSTVKDMKYMCVKTFSRKIWIAYGTFLAVARGRGQVAGTLNRIFNMSIAKGETVSFTKIFTLYTSRDISARKIREKTINELQRAKKHGFEALLKRHTIAWQNRWERSDVKIEGDDEAQKALRFNIYHLLISGNDKDDNVNIGARTLSGDGYRGHVFWDTEIFILPFFIHTNPTIARNLLLYRYHRINEARRIAKDKGYRGTLFPWESADTGEETTPPYAKNLDGTIIEIRTMDMEHHIVCDIAYGVAHYYKATKDIEFMLKYGLEILFGSARFWASRVSLDKTRKRYNIKRVIGPDEFHENVDNNAYTNAMAAWNLRKAKELYEYFSNRESRFLKRITKRMALWQDEVANWEKVANKIKTPIKNSEGVIGEFDGYFRKRDIVIKSYDDYFMPVMPKDLEVINFGNTRLVKQADVLMLIYLLHGSFSQEEKRRNYAYYVKRTLHKSSLSPSIHSIIASWVGDVTRAYLFFLFSVYGDLKNMHGNSGEGMHGASLGGTWQAVTMGFSGFRIENDMPSFEPHLPGHWRSISFRIMWRRCDIDVKVTNTEGRFLISSKKTGNMHIKYFGHIHNVPLNRVYIAKRMNENNHGQKSHA
ncbi:MAG: glycosyl hydrolase family 65 protein [Candidatus Omnitrophota bacterium]